MSSREAQAAGGLEEEGRPHPQQEEDVEEQEWSGAFDPFADPEERRVLFASLDSFRRQSFYALPSLHWQTLAAPPFKLLETFDKVDAAIDSNAEVAEAILDSALEAFQLPKHPQTQEAEGRGDVNWHDRATSSDVSKANSTIRQLYRDWSAGGAGERESCYGPVMRDLQAEFGEKPAPGTRVLIPGAGLGRLFKKVLVPDVHPGSAVRGYEEAEETAGATGGRKETKKMTGTMSMTAADFLLLYNEESNREAFHAVATVFFIDTAPNLIRYIQTVHHCLRPGGIWTNVGPLLWHFEDKPAPSSSRTQSTSGKVVEDAAASAHAPGDDDLEKEYQGHSHGHHGHSHGHSHSHSHGRGHGGQGEGIGDPGVVELSQDEVLALIERIGFTIEKVEDDIGGCGYIQDPDSMLFNMYKPVHWIARKR
ncbi:uncharacterized protein MCYG_06530 [Microsporum canis CBS 113480]|uniref:carnosine N-methyltransferase n=1 Tax=Arthroderma otae (strain ATCC MYA-4605 / CBS 113480) TaxID=554155 RepID=C5FUX7_ARTOC|nr:uncharacterized protein MCYG_06530 [Microsporum canis CBS 113480]EEQ33711.1 hypothetical protein MCYG_06530 [Microsporum canis CBS 113480]